MTRRARFDRCSDVRGVTPSERLKVRGHAKDRRYFGDFSGTIIVPLTPIGRLDAAEQRLDATIKAIQVVRSPLERFY
jgi:hypothetical protein